MAGTLVNRVLSAQMERQQTLYKVTTWYKMRLPCVTVMCTAGVMVTTLWRRVRGRGDLYWMHNYIVAQTVRLQRGYCHQSFQVLYELCQGRIREEGMKQSTSKN